MHKVDREGAILKAVIFIRMLWTTAARRFFLVWAALGGSRFGRSFRENPAENLQPDGETVFRCRVLTHATRLRLQGLHLGAGARRTDPCQVDPAAFSLWGRL